MTIELLIICTVAAVYGMVLGTAAAGERVPFVSAAWEIVRRPVDWLVSAATRRGPSPHLSREDRPDMSTETDALTFSDEIADLAADALQGYAIAESDLIDAGSEVLQAAGPALVAAELRRLADSLVSEEDAHKIWRAIARRADELDPPS